MFGALVLAASVLRTGFAPEKGGERRPTLRFRGGAAVTSLSVVEASGRSAGEGACTTL